ncbi:hypothetical protein [Mucilaginibacter phyllosphaerae]|uniref:Uncharacterized protein n=1 Tax=Mucilaginibacter phyllosphaerae TaxID=1812349 RepID=A0A4Y8AL63_9SPHI|nr:hypothetical protein [Mucilaginibacter phyllosphaerae]MBB3967738.1 hypothetical protein [Mucilaginibacter phyllosphaerae]TEW69211.1 hypothetical protein E2R65_03320 [Mucilaginibacter phyllosphaerae]GGH03662.1 hypothetical protein GCM10007352_06430 [Mucilaginibacter phyllosphaerae]
MTQLQLYINDELVDLSDDSPIALTFQINNLAEVKNQQGNTSNQFKLPLTQRNRQILGFPDEVAFTTNLPYDNYQAKIIQDGLEIVPAGIAVLNNIENDTAAITILSGNVDFFDAIDYKIYDMGDSTTTVGLQKIFQSYEHSWTIDNVLASQTRTEGWIWPVVDYGRLLYPTDPVMMDVRDMRPGFFVKTAIELMAKQAGYKINPNSFLLKQPLYDKLIVQFANDNFEHGSDIQNQPDYYGATAYIKPTLNVNHLTVRDNAGIIPFSNIGADQLQQYNGTRFTARNVSTVNVSVKIPKFRLQGRVTGYPASVNIIIYKHSSLGDEQLSVLNYDFSEWNNNDRISGNGGNIYGWHEFEQRILSADAELTVGDEISIRYEFFGNTHASFTLYEGASLIIKTLNLNVLYKQPVQCERIFPDIGQKDFLKDILQRFGIICQTDNTNRTITFASFRDIVERIPAAKNWTAKCLDQGKNISFQLGGYAQVNYLKNKEDDNILPKKYGDAQIEVKDKTLPATTTLFESQFAPTLNRSFINGTIALIDKVDHTDAANTEYNVSTAPRLLIDKKVNLLNLSKAITFTDGTTTRVYNDTISTPYFYKPDGDFNLCFSDMPGTAGSLKGLKNNYYPELEKILQQTKKVDRFFMLSPRDILELDLLIPIYLEQDSAYYYINKIDSWRKDQPVKVELVKLG